MKLSTQRLSQMRQRIWPYDSNRLRALTYQFDLLRHLVWRDFSLRYKQSVLGILWSLLLPVAQLLVMVFLFQSVVPLNIDAYPAFVFCALLPWGWFSGCLGSSGGLFLGNRDLVRHPNFVPVRLAIVNTLSNLITYLAALPILLLVLVAYGRPITFALLLFPVLMLIQATLTIGLSLIIATLNVFFRDVQHIVTVSLLLLFYLTPVFYRPQSVAAKYHLVYEINPIAVLIQGYRDIFFNGTYPAWGPMLLAAVVSVVVYGLGVIVYNYQQHELIDTI
jgi:ABC-type polysaccharide/polyol phosphate export permease